MLRRNGEFGHAVAPGDEGGGVMEQRSNTGCSLGGGTRGGHAHASVVGAGAIIRETSATQSPEKVGASSTCGPSSAGSEDGI
jgi:hypothetical protein